MIIRFSTRAQAITFSAIVALAVALFTGWLVIGRVLERERVARHQREQGLRLALTALQEARIQWSQSCEALLPSLAERAFPSGVGLAKTRAPADGSRPALADVPFHLTGRNGLVAALPKGRLFSERPPCEPEVPPELARLEAEAASGAVPSDAAQPYVEHLTRVANDLSRTGPTRIGLGWLDCERTSCVAVYAVIDGQTPTSVIRVETKRAADTAKASAEAATRLATLAQAETAKW